MIYFFEAYCTGRCDTFGGKYNVFAWDSEENVDPFAPNWMCLNSVDTLKRSLMYDARVWE